MKFLSHVPLNWFSLDLRRSFTNTAVAFQNPNHRLYPKIDWDKVAGGLFAIVDPADPTAILYLSDRDYKIQIRVSLSTDSPLVVLARAGEVRQVEPTVSQQTGPKGDVPSATTTSAKSVTSKEVKDSPSKNTPPKGANGPPAPQKEKIDLFSSWSKKFVSRKWHKLFNWAKTTFSNYEVKDAEDALVSINESNVVDLIRRWGTLSQHWSGRGLSPHTAIKESLDQISSHLLKVLKGQGPNGVILLLKTTSVCLRRFLAGNPVENSWSLGHPLKVGKSGIPLWLPLQFRHLIRARSSEGLRLVFSILNAYKGFKSPYNKMDLTNIVAPHPTVDEDELGEFAAFCSKVFWPKVVTPCAIDAGKLHLLKVVSEDGSVKLPEVSPPFLRTAGPNSPTSVLGASLDAQAWNLEPVNWLVEYLQETGDKQTLDIFHAVLEASSPAFTSRTLPGLWSERKAKGGKPTKQLRELRLGKLSLKLEAAGKKRIFAIVDYWTQRALKPLHTWMADVLSVLPSDATFDQNGAVRRFALSEPSACHSYDLKAATDTIPQVLYETLFKAILPPVLVDKWMLLLTDRWYYTPESERDDHPDLPKMVRYTRGQPMGALSSWPSMALVHHAVILYSAFKEGRPVSKALWWDYRVLGDDAVIGDQEVGLTYVAQTNSLHIKIGLKVSLISAPALKGAMVEANPVPSAICEWVYTPAHVAAYATYRRAARIVALGPMFEFANQFWLGTVDISPASLKQELGIRTWSQRLEYALRILLRWGSGPSGSWVARLCRYLLPPALYEESVEQWKQGRLGSVLQIALAMAFGPASSLTRRIGFQWSTLEPLLLALTNSSKILMGRGSSFLGQNQPGGGNVDLHLSLCLAYVRVLLRELEGVRARLVEMEGRGPEKFVEYYSMGPGPRSASQEAPPPKIETGLRRLLRELLSQEECRTAEKLDEPLLFDYSTWWSDLQKVGDLQWDLGRMLVLYTKALERNDRSGRASSVPPLLEVGEIPSLKGPVALPTLGSDRVSLAAVFVPYTPANDKVTDLVLWVEPRPAPHGRPDLDLTRSLHDQFGGYLHAALMISMGVQGPASLGTSTAEVLDASEDDLDEETDDLDAWGIDADEIQEVTADQATSDLFKVFEDVAKAPTFDEAFSKPELFAQAAKDTRKGRRVGPAHSEAIRAWSRLVSATAPALKYHDFLTWVDPSDSILNTRAIADMWQGATASDKDTKPN